MVEPLLEDLGVRVVGGADEHMVEQLRAVVRRQASPRRVGGRAEGRLGRRDEVEGGGGEEPCGEAGCPSCCSHCQAGWFVRPKTKMAPLRCWVCRGARGAGGCGVGRRTRLDPGLRKSRRHAIAAISIMRLRFLGHDCQERACRWYCPLRGCGRRLAGAAGGDAGDGAMEVATDDPLMLLS